MEERTTLIAVLVVIVILLAGCLKCPWFGRQFSTCAAWQGASADKFKPGSTALAELATAVAVVLTEVPGPVTCVVLDPTGQTILAMSRQGSKIGQKLARAKAKAAVFYRGYAKVSRSQLSDTKNTGLMQQLARGDLSPVAGSRGIVNDGELYGIGIMSDAADTVSGAYKQDDQVITDILAKTSDWSLVPLKH